MQINQFVANVPYIRLSRSAGHEVHCPSHRAPDEGHRSCQEEGRDDVVEAVIGGRMAIAVTDDRSPGDAIGRIEEIASRQDVSWRKCHCTVPRERSREGNCAVSSTGSQQQQGYSVVTHVSFDGALEGRGLR
jgi:hypothetical protein